MFLRVGSDERLTVWSILSGAGALTPHAVEAPKREDVISILAVIRDVIRIGKDQHIVIGCAGPAGIDPDDYLPMTSPVNPINHDGDASVDIIDQRLFQIFDGLEFQICCCVVFHIPSDQIKKVCDVFYGASLPRSALDQLCYQLFVISLCVKPVQYHQCTGSAAGIFRGLLVCLKVGQYVQCPAAAPVVVVIGSIVSGAGMIRQSDKGGSALFVQTFLISMELCGILT